MVLVITLFLLFAFVVSIAGLGFLPGLAVFLGGLLIIVVLYHIFRFVIGFAKKL